MNFINKIKSNYNIKLIEDQILNFKYHDARISLRSLMQKDQETLFKTLLVIDQKLRELSSVEYFNQKYIWLNSFSEDDTSYLSNFFKFYFKKHYNGSSIFQNYALRVSEILDELKISDIPKIIDFTNSVFYSSILQNLVQLYQNIDCSIMSNQSAFFESKSDNKYLIYPNSTLCYFHIVRNPIEEYLSLKHKSNSSDLAMHELFNFGDELFLCKNLDNLSYKFYQNRQSWNIHTKSWIDPNVVSTYKGTVIYYNSLVNNTEEVLVNSIYHIKQSGLDIDVNFNTIDEFVSSSKPDPFASIEISKNEKKKILVNLDNDLINELKIKI